MSKLKSAAPPPPNVTWKWARALGKKIERGLKSKDPAVVALAEVAREFGRALYACREKSGAVCGICVWNGAVYRTFKRGPGDVAGWNRCCKACAPIARNHGWEVRK